MSDLGTLDLEFHDLVVSRSKHRLLQEVLSSLAVYTRGFIVHTKNYYGADLVQVGESHPELADALASRDPLRAEAAVQAHVREAAKRLALIDGMAADSR